MQDKLKLNLSY